MLCDVGCLLYHITDPQNVFPISVVAFRFESFFKREPSIQQMVDLGSQTFPRMDEERTFQIDELPSRTRVSSALFHRYIRPCVAEMLATMSFVFVDVCSVYMYAKNQGTYAGFTHGFILFVLVASTASIR